MRRELLAVLVAATISLTDITAATWTVEKPTTMKNSASVSSPQEPRALVVEEKSDPVKPMLRQEDRVNKKSGERGQFATIIKKVVAKVKEVSYYAKKMASGKKPSDIKTYPEYATYWGFEEFVDKIQYG
uniref:RxLR effector candidate protein n=1 Tax=Hyaloperonospora arabidopsidis (strain Emoy2) TaxID=559515 RepID=A0A090B911_HYAAE|nr:RxLR effector candidate protein [Hyaloperonospora arabidopsidis Emoy2]